MKLYINKQNIVTSGDIQPDTIRELTQEETELFLQGEGYAVENFQVIDISQTAEYLQQKNTLKKTTILLEIDELDKKRIRAICEPAMRNDGQSWLDYYTSQIQEKRQEIFNLS